VTNNLLSLQPFCQININGIVAVHVLSILEQNTRCVFLKFLTCWKNTECRFRICLKDSVENAILFSVTKTLLKMLYRISIFLLKYTTKIFELCIISLKTPTPTGKHRKQEHILMLQAGFEPTLTD
jgi:hypothetical protein